MHHSPRKKNLAPFPALLAFRLEFPSARHFSFARDLTIARKIDNRMRDAERTSDSFRAVMTIWSMHSYNLSPCMLRGEISPWAGVLLARESGVRHYASPRRRT